MKIAIDNVTDAQAALGLLSQLIALILSIRAGIMASSNINTEDKDALIAQLEAMKLPEWKDL